MIIDSANESLRDLWLPDESEELTDLLILLFAEVMCEAVSSTPHWPKQSCRPLQRVVLSDSKCTVLKNSVRGLCLFLRNLEVVSSVKILFSWQISCLLASVVCGVWSIPAFYYKGYSIDRTVWNWKYGALWTHSRAVHVVHKWRSELPVHTETNGNHWAKPIQRL